MTGALTARVALACALAAVAALAPEAAAQGESGRLRASTSFDTSRGRPIEGWLDFFRVRNSAGRLVFERQASRLDEPLASGRYRLRSFQRTCAGNCDRLDPPSPGCARELRIRAGAILRVRVHVAWHRPGCVMALSSDRRAAQAAARRAAWRQTQPLGGAGFRPRDWRASCALGQRAWSCRVRARGDVCRGTVRITGVPGRFRASRGGVGCGEVGSGSAG